ncbi:MAG: tRNA dihydrouridine synthase DusB [Candidatus Omnitrophica bacterium]|nr:tRNA dihydrouridine synthase DusB [Candidatus Omnitrophota bacterium]
MDTQAAINRAQIITPIEEMIRAKAILAPMSGVTDFPFRMMARKHGCKYAFTEMIDVNGIVYKNRKSFRLLERNPVDDPLAVQLVGQDADKLVHVARLCVEKGFELVDINAGCPARKVVKCGKGSALMKDPVKFARIIRKLVKALSVPVTVKIRSGWEEENLNYLEVVRAAESEGASAVCVHPRTKDKMYKGKPDHEITQKIKMASKIPVFASGNIFTADDAARVLEETGCDAVFVARGALGHPWIFDEIENKLSGTEDDNSMTFEDIKDAIMEHFFLSVGYHGEKMSFKKMYKHITWYLKKKKNLDCIMKEYRKIETLEDLKEFLERLQLREGNKLELLRAQHVSAPTL